MRSPHSSMSWKLRTRCLCSSTPISAQTATEKPSTSCSVFTPADCT